MTKAAEAFARAIATDWRAAPLDPRGPRACASSRPLLTHGQHGMTPGHLDALRSLGLDDRAIHDAVQVIGYFNYITRVADALGVEAEGHIPPRGPRR